MLFFGREGGRGFSNGRIISFLQQTQGLCLHHMRHLLLQWPIQWLYLQRWGLEWVLLVVGYLLSVFFVFFSLFSTCFMVRFVLVPSFFREKWLEEISDEALLSALEEQEDMQPGANQRKHKFSDCSMESEHFGRWRWEESIVSTMDV